MSTAKVPDAIWAQAALVNPKPEWRSLPPRRILAGRDPNTFNASTAAPFRASPTRGGSDPS
jgi:hypothetical protein